MRDFHSLDGALEGQGGDAIRGFYKNTHEPFLIHLHQTLTNYKQALKVTSEAIHSFESDSEGYVSQDFLLNDVKESYDQAGKTAKALTDEANQIINSVQDIVSIKEIDETEMMDSVSKGKEQVDTISEEFIEVDNEGASRLEETQDDLKTMQTFLSEMSTKFDSSASISNYSVASTRDMTSIKTISDGVYSEGVPTEEIEKAKDARDSVLKNLNASSSKNIINKAYQEFKSGDINYEQYTDILNSIKKISDNSGGTIIRVENDVNVNEEFITYLKDRGMLEDYLEEHQSVADYVVKSMPGLLFRSAKGITPGFLEKLGYNQRDLAEELIKTEKVTNLLNKSDSKLSKGIVDELENSAKFFKYSKIATYGSKTLGAAGSFYTVYGDVAHQGKTKGEGLAHVGALTAVGAAFAAMTPVGWGVMGAAGFTIVGSAIFEGAYQYVPGVEYTVDKIGHGLSWTGNKIWSKLGDNEKEIIKSPGPTMINPAMFFYMNK